MTIETVTMLAIMMVILIQTSYMLYKLQHQQVRSKNQSVYVDTSVLIDGRILSIAETGFITAELVIPRSVVGELQFLADGSDHEKRARARHGLDIATKLRECDSVTVTLLQDGVASRGVDERLLELAKKHGGMICTIDYNLNKVAQVEGIRVLNVNELAKNVRFFHLPGETRQIELTQKGQDSHQGIGYIEDGTMVVVEHASKYIGKKVEVEFIRALQTDAGKMMFAKLKTAAINESKKRPQNGRKPLQTSKSQQPESKPTPKPKAKSERKSSGQRQNAPRTRETNEDRLINLIDSSQ